MDQQTGKVSNNLNDTYLKGKYKTEVYRYNPDTLAIYFPKGQSTVTAILPKFDELSIDYQLYLEGDYESVYHFPEDQIHKVNQVLKFQFKGRNIKPNSVKTARRLK